MAGRWWRRAKIGAAAVAVLLLALQALVLWLESAKGRAALARLVAEKLANSLRQPVAVGDVRLQLLPLQLSVQNLRVGPESHPAVEIAGAQVNLGSFQLADREIGLNLVQVKGLRVRSQAAFGASSGGGGTPLRVSVRQLVVQDASLDQLQLAPGFLLSVSDFQLMVSGRPERGFQGAFLRAGAFKLEGTGGQPLAGSLEAWGQVFPEKVELRRLILQASGVNANVSGEVAWTPAVAVRLAGLVVGDLAQVDEFFGIGIGLDGQVQAHSTITVSGSGFAVDAEVASQRVRVVGFEVNELAGRVHVSPDGVEATLDSGRFAGGQVEGSYQLADFGPTFNHRVALRGHGVGIDDFLSFLGIGRGGLAARASVSAELAWEGSQIGQGRGVAVVRLSPAGDGIPAEGQLVVALRSDSALHFEARNLALSGGSVSWQGTLALGSWIPQWSVASPGVPLEAVSSLLAGWVGQPLLPESLSGTAVFDLTISGPFTDLTVAGPVALSPVCLGPIEADALEGEINLSQGALRFSHGKLALGSGTIRFSGELDLKQASPGLRLDYAGRSLPLSRFARWAGLKFPLEGTGAVTGMLSGSLDRPELDAQLKFEGVSVVGLPLGQGEAHATLQHQVLRVEPLTLGGVSGSLEVDFATHRVSVITRVRGLGLEPLSPVLARLLGGQVEAEFVGDFPWEEPAGRFTLQSAQGVAGEVTLGPQGLVASLRRPNRWSFFAEVKQEKRSYSGSATLRVDSLSLLLKDLLGSEVPVEGELEAQMRLALGPSGPPSLFGTITKAVLVAEGEKVSLTNPAPFTLQGLHFELPGLDLSGPSAQLFLRGSRQLDGSLSGNISASVPASLVGILWRDAAPRGRLEVVGEISGTEAAPRVEGVLRLEGGSLRIPGLPAPVTGIDGVAELAGDVMSLRKVRFAFQGGTGTCSGQLRLWPALELDLALSVSGVRWPLTQGFEPSLDGELRLGGDLSGLQLSGQLSLRRSVYRRDVSLQRLVLEELAAPERAAAGERGLVAFDVRIAIPGTLEVHTPLARVVAQGELRLVGDSSQPGLLGQVELLPGGELELAGVTYEVERASIRFVDANRIRPVVDLQARGLVQNFTVTVGLSGTLDRLVPTLSSDPPLPESDILALVALGVSPTSTGTGAASASAMASSFITDQLTGAVTSRTRTLLALDQLRIDPFVTTEAGTPTARVTMVKQLSPDWSVTVSSNLSSNREEVIQSRWRVGKDLFLEATRDTDGSYSLEVKWRRRY
ncbi:MAG: hypothetical protein KatS3mg007_1336 [Thermoanaerobaculum sp.]|nr:MAG: hypothetical protein KatS3mg007_1336 [Thermoanaerobaculum sp.]